MDYKPLHKHLSSQSIGTLEKLIEKENSRQSRMPSITAIHKLLEELKVQHSFSESVNVVEYRTKRRKYVNSRYEGRKGYKISIIVPEEADAICSWRVIDLDTSKSYYNANGSQHARKLLEYFAYLIKFRKVQPPVHDTP